MDSDQLASSKPANLNLPCFPEDVKDSKQVCLATETSYNIGFLTIASLAITTLRVNNKGPEQTGQMCTLVSTFAVCMQHSQFNLL